MQFKVFAGAFLLAVMAATASSNEPTVYRVEKARRDQVTEFVPDGDRFRRAEKIPAGRVQGARVVEASPRGYVKVETAAGQVWLDKLDVEISPKLPVKADCLVLVSAPVDTTAGIVRGAGGACE